MRIEPPNLRAPALGSRLLWVNAAIHGRVFYGEVFLVGTDSAMEGDPENGDVGHAWSEIKASGENDSFVRTNTPSAGA